jgi:hypothetical protein
MDIDQRLQKIESMLETLLQQQTIKDFYEIEEFAALVGKAKFTVREWARLGRIHAQKRRSGRGAHAEWVISHAEYERFQREGLLPGLCARIQRREEFENIEREGRRDPSPTPRTG